MWVQKKSQCLWIVKSSFFENVRLQCAADCRHVLCFCSHSLQQATPWLSQVSLGDDLQKCIVIKKDWFCIHELTKTVQSCFKDNWNIINACHGWHQAWHRLFSRAWECQSWTGVYLNRREQSWMWTSSSLNWQAGGRPTQHHTHKRVLSSQVWIDTQQKHLICFCSTFLQNAFDSMIFVRWWTFLQENEEDKNFLPMTQNNTTTYLALFSSQCINESDNVITRVHWD